MDMQKVIIAKTPVSELQEWCAKKKEPLPVYEYTRRLEIGFECRVHTLHSDGFACGHTKRISKHQAAADALKKLKE